MSSGIHESTGSYAVHALDPVELAEYEAHLGGCISCQDEVDQFSETAAELALLVEATPPAGMRDRILGSIIGLPQAPASTNGGVVRRLPQAERPTGPRRAAPGSLLVVEEEPEPPRVDELSVRRQRRGSRVMSSLVAAVLALAVGLGGVVYMLVQERQTQVASQRLEEELLRAPDAKIIVAPLDAGGQVTFVVSKQLNRAQFIGKDLPDPGQDRYQLWTGTGAPRPGEIDSIARDVQVSADGGDVEAFFSGDIAQSDFLAVNLEPAGSTPDAPTNDPIAGGVI